MVGSSPKTSSPTFAANIASSILGEGLVTVSDLRSTIIYRICSEGIPAGLQYSQFTPQLMQLTKAGRFYALPLLNWYPIMSEPSTIQLIVIAICCLVLGIIGLYFLINFNRLFRGVIKNELLRKNVAAWVVIFLLSLAATPLSGGLGYMVNKFGWWGSILIEIVTSLAYTLVIYNSARAIAASKKLKRLSFIQHRLLMLVALVVTALAINLTSVHVLYGSDKKFPTYLKYSIFSSIYIMAAIGIVYTVINFLDMQRKRKFDEKELE